MVNSIPLERIKVQPGSIQQGRIDLAHGGVEDIRLQKRHMILRANGIVVGIKHGPVQNITLIQDYPFGLPG